MDLLQEVLNQIEAELPQVEVYGDQAAETRLGVLEGTLNSMDNVQLLDRIGWVLNDKYKEL